MYRSDHNRFIIADKHGAYTWSITFPDETFDVPRLIAIGNFTHPDVEVRAEVVNSTYLHGYHLTIDLVNEPW